MLISVCINAVMLEVNVQNVLRQLQHRRSVACAPFTDRVVNHFLVQTVPFILNTLAQLFHVRDTMVLVHTLLKVPTPHSPPGSDPDCSVATERTE